MDDERSWEWVFVWAVVSGIIAGGILGCVFAFFHPDLTNNYVILNGILVAFIPCIIISVVTGRIWAAPLSGGVGGGIFGVILAMVYTADNDLKVYPVGTTILGLLIGGGGGLVGAGLLFLRTITPRPNTRFARGSGRFWWTVLFGVVADGIILVFSSTSPIHRFISSFVYIPGFGYPLLDLVFSCIIIGGAGFITMRMVGTRVLTGLIAGMILVGVQACYRYVNDMYFNPYSSHRPDLYLLQETPYFLEIIGVAMLCSFIGGWLATRGRNP